MSFPCADAADGFEEKSASGDPQGPVAVTAESEEQKLRSERNDLFDRLARLQAEFDNYRKRAAKEKRRLPRFRRVRCGPGVIAGDG